MVAKRMQMEIIALKVKVFGSEEECKELHSSTVQNRLQMPSNFFLFNLARTFTKRVSSFRVSVMCVITVSRINGSNLLLIVRGSLCKCLGTSIAIFAVGYAECLVRCDANQCSVNYV